MDLGRQQGRVVTARSWCRVDLAGGTLDIWPLGVIHPGSRTVNVAVDLAVRVEMARSSDGFRVRQGAGTVEASSAAELATIDEAALVGLVAASLDLPPFEIGIDSASPRGGGLGASSALMVSIIAASEKLFGHETRTPQERAALARDLEAMLMHLPTGRQDHFPAQLGGVLEVLHAPGGERVSPIDTDIAALGESLVVAYSGESHFSAGTNWRIIRNRLDGDPLTTRCFDGISHAAIEVAAALRAGELERVGKLMAEEWHWRRQLANGISTPIIERLLESARAVGAWGGKVCGAGGGGCLALLCPPPARASVEAAIIGSGGQILVARPTSAPLEVHVIDDRSDG